MTQYAKLSVAAAASLQFVRTLHNEETHENVRNEVFGQAKINFGIPDKHRIKVELNPEAEDYLFIVRKKDGTKYELDPANGRWVQAEPLPTVVSDKVFVRIPLATLREIAVDLVREDNQGDIEVLGSDSMPNLSLDVTQDVLMHEDSVYVKVDENLLDPDQDAYLGGEDDEP